MVETYDLGTKRQWLADNPDKKGTPFYNKVVDFIDEVVAEGLEKVPPDNMLKNYEGREKKSVVESALRGGVQGATLGLSDEAVGFASATGKPGTDFKSNAIRNLAGLPGLLYSAGKNAYALATDQDNARENYSNAVDAERYENLQANWDNPDVYENSELVGGMLGAGTPIVGAAKGAIKLGAKVLAKKGSKAVWKLNADGSKELIKDAVKGNALAKMADAGKNKIKKVVDLKNAGDKFVKGAGDTLSKVISRSGKGTMSNPNEKAEIGAKMIKGMMPASLVDAGGLAGGLLSGNMIAGALAPIGIKAAGYVGGKAIDAGKTKVGQYVLRKGANAAAAVTANNEIEDAQREHDSQFGEWEAEINNRGEKMALAERYKRQNSDADYRVKEKALNKLKSDKGMTDE